MITDTRGTRRRGKFQPKIIIEQSGTAVHSHWRSVHSRRDARARVRSARHSARRDTARTFGGNAPEEPRHSSVEPLSTRAIVRRVPPAPTENLSTDARSVRFRNSEPGGGHCPHACRAPRSRGFRRPCRRASPQSRPRGAHAHGAPGMYTTLASRRSHQRSASPRPPTRFPGHIKRPWARIRSKT